MYYYLPEIVDRSSKKGRPRQTLGTEENLSQNKKI
jgi:hypothetical protein